MSSPTSRERLGLLLGFVGMAIFGGTLPATRIAVAEIDPIALTSLRTVIAGLCSLVLLLVLRRKLPPRALWPQLVIAMPTKPSSRPRRWREAMEVMMRLVSCFAGRRTAIYSEHMAAMRRYLGAMLLHTNPRPDRNSSASTTS